ncbi:MAG: hypothetical protein HYZ35_00340 [Chloroflexi bacterium]|nr:hypothetical protein [Chloroflexota bacterium]
MTAFTPVAVQATVGIAPVAGPGSRADVAILRAVLYADVFDYALTLPQVHRYLEGEAMPLEAVREALVSSPWLAGRVEMVDGYVVASGRAGLARERRRRAEQARRLWSAAQWYGRWMARLPFARMVAVTGALSMDNVDGDDDIDYFIVTAPGRVWLTRAFSILLVRLARLTGANLCPNYLLADSALLQERRDLFVAHELAQMVPLVGKAVYERIWAANVWLVDILPNVSPLAHAVPEASEGGPGHWAQRALEWALGGKLGDVLENWERTRKLAKFRQQMAVAGAGAAALDENRVKGHFHDYGAIALAEFEKRCRAYLGGA